MVDIIIEPYIIVEPWCTRLRGLNDISNAVRRRDSKRQTRLLGTGSVVVVGFGSSIVLVIIDSHRDSSCLMGLCKILAWVLTYFLVS